MKKKPIRANLHQAPKAISNSDKKNLVGASSSRRMKTEAKQREIDVYNKLQVKAPIQGLDDMQFVGGEVIIQLHKENYIKRVEILPSGDPLYDAYISQIDARETRAAKAKWIDTPFPYVFTGVVKAMSVETEVAYVQKKAELTAVDAELGAKFHALKVGDIVHLSHFMMNDKRFYVNKQERDFVKTPSEHRIIHFEGLVKVHSAQIDAVVTNVEAFEHDLSPFMQYEEYMINEGKAKDLVPAAKDDVRAKHDARNQYQNAMVGKEAIENAFIDLMVTGKAQEIIEDKK